jgi:hypothetical protein
MGDTKEKSLFSGFGKLPFLSGGELTPLSHRLPGF